MSSKVSDTCHLVSLQSFLIVNLKKYEYSDKIFLTHFAF